jgi:hypothetical protein
VPELDVVAELEALVPPAFVPVVLSFAVGTLSAAQPNKIAETIVSGANNWSTKFGAIDRGLRGDFTPAISRPVY